jgi:hypothetical protein
MIVDYYSFLIDVIETISDRIYVFRKQYYASFINTDQVVDGGRLYVFHKLFYAIFIISDHCICLLLSH